MDGLHLCIFARSAMTRGRKEQCRGESWFYARFPRAESSIPTVVYQPLLYGNDVTVAWVPPQLRLSLLLARERVDSIGKVSRAARRLFES